jgi:hypothetical protein
VRIHFPRRNLHPLGFAKKAVADKSKEAKGFMLKRQHEFMNGQKDEVIEATTRMLAIRFDSNNDIEYFEPSELEIN